MAPPPEFDPIPAHGPARDAIPSAPADDDFALGWECATPALQIEGWDGEPSRGAEFH